jgi:hypothetical protein
VTCCSANFRCVSTVFFEGSSSNSFGEHEADCTVQAGKMQRMKESYGEGLASHTGSESCGHGRKAGYEALTGGTTGQVIEPRNIPNFRTPTP